MQTSLRVLTQTVVLLVSGSLVLAQQPAVQERVAALKASLATSQAVLKQYEWIETTIVSVKGEEKSRQMNRCYHGADGKVQKVPVTTPPPEEKKRGLRGKIAESKKEEMTDYMKQAVALIKEYLPPDQARIQAVKDAGKLSLTPLPNQRVRLTFADYAKEGDSLALDLDLGSNRPLEAKVSSYLNSKEDAVTLDVRFSTLDNNATYAAASVLDAKAKNLRVDVQNSGYRRAGN
jgi:hypothetical protein